MLDLKTIALKSALRAAAVSSSAPVKVSVLTTEEKIRELKEQNAPELEGSGGGLGFAAHLEERRDAAMITARRRAMVREAHSNSPAQHRIDRAKAEKAKRKKMKKRGH
jgi:hypothetical protein